MDKNPIVLLTNNTWHIVEHSRQSTVALCGKKVHEGRAHARLTLVGADNVCAVCRQRWSAGREDESP